MGLNDTPTALGCACYSVLFMYTRYTESCPAYEGVMGKYEGVMGPYEGSKGQYEGVMGQ